jgi:hypothetical protein
MEEIKPIRNQDEITLRKYILFSPVFPMDGFEFLDYIFNKSIRPFIRSSKIKNIISLINDK